MPNNSNSFNTIISQVSNNQVNQASFASAGITNLDCVRLAEAIRVTTSLQYLDLRTNSIGLEGLRQLVDAMKINTSIRSLILHGNPLGPLSGESIADMLRINRVLRQLILGVGELGCNLGDQGVLPIIQALPESKLEVLDFSSNGLASVSIAMFAQVPPNPELEWLSFYNNPGIGSSNPIDFKNMLGHYAELSVVSFERCGLSNGHGIAMGEVLPDTNWKTLFINSNNMNNLGKEPIKNGLNTQYFLQNIFIDPSSFDTQIQTSLTRNRDRCIGKIDGTDSLWRAQDIFNRRCPVLKTNKIMLEQSRPHLLTSDHLSVIDTAGDIILDSTITIGSVTNVSFQHLNGSVATQFTPKEINDGLIIVETNSSNASYSVMANYAGLNTSARTAEVILLPAVIPEITTTDNIPTSSTLLNVSIPTDNISPTPPTIEKHCEDAPSLESYIGIIIALPIIGLAICVLIYFYYRGKNLEEKLDAGNFPKNDNNVVMRRNPLYQSPEQVNNQASVLLNTGYERGNAIEADEVEKDPNTGHTYHIIPDNFRSLASRISRGVYSFFRPSDAQAINATVNNEPSTLQLVSRV